MSRLTTLSALTALTLLACAAPVNEAGEPDLDETSRWGADDEDLDAAAPADSEVTYDLEVVDVWSESDSYVGVGTWIDAQATITNHGPDRATFHVDVTMISDNAGTTGEPEGNTDEGWFDLDSGHSLDLFSGWEMGSGFMPSACHWRVTVTPEWGQVDTDIDNDSGESEIFHTAP